MQQLKTGPGHHQIQGRKLHHTARNLEDLHAGCQISCTEAGRRKTSDGADRRYRERIDQTSTHHRRLNRKRSRQQVRDDLPGIGCTGSPANDAAMQRVLPGQQADDGLCRNRPDDGHTQDGGEAHRNSLSCVVVVDSDSNSTHNVHHRSITHIECSKPALPTVSLRCQAFCTIIGPINRTQLLLGSIEGIEQCLIRVTLCHFLHYYRKIPRCRNDIRRVAWQGFDVRNQIKQPRIRFESRTQRPAPVHRSNLPQYMQRSDARRQRIVARQFAPDLEAPEQHFVIIARV